VKKKKEIGIMEFVEKYKDDDKCREALFDSRFSEGFRCPKCNSKKYSYHNKRHLYQCSKCRYQCSLTAGTIMHRSHIPLHKWFMAMYLIAKDKRGYSAMQLSRELNIGYKSAWYLLQRLRKAMKERNGNYCLSGIVEVDDTYFGGKKKGGKRGRGTKKAKVIVALSKDEEGKPKHLRMQVVSNLKSRTVRSFASKNIVENSQIQTDALNSYRKLSVDKFGHQYQIFDPDTQWLHWIHTIIENAKALVEGTFHGLDKKHLQLYLDEYCFKFDRRYFGSFIFDRLLLAVTLSSPLSFAELTE